MEDPYYSFRDEVEDNIQNAENQTREWEVLRSSAQSGQRAEWVKEEIKTKLEPIRKMLVDLEKMNSAVLANPSRFNISQIEIDNRRGFISKTRNRIGQIEAKLNAPQQDSPELRAAAKRDRLTRARIEDNQRAIDNELQNQQVQLQRQDEDLEVIGGEVATIGHIANQINDELRDQNSHLTHVNDHMTELTLKLETTT